MRFEDEPSRHDVLQCVDAAGDLEDAVATGAVEMVVVTLPVQLVPRHFAGELDGNQPSLVHEGPDVPVHRRDADPANFAAGGDQDLLRAQGSVRTLQGTSYSTTLTGVTFHRSRVSSGHDRRGNAQR